jgi:hypothetical protein
MFFDKIQPLYFFIAFAIGLLLCYITNPKPDIVMKFPSPYNAGQVIYKDKANTCYKYQADKVSCPTDKALIKPQPIQEDFKAKK